MFRPVEHHTGPLVCTCFVYYSPRINICFFLFYLVPKQSSMYNLSILSERSEKSHHKYETLNLSKYNSASPPLSRATSPLNHDREGGMKVNVLLFTLFHSYLL